MPTPFRHLHSCPVVSNAGHLVWPPGVIQQEARLTANQTTAHRPAPHNRILGAQTSTAWLLGNPVLAFIKNLSYFNLSECNIIFLNSNLHSHECAGTKSLLQGRNFPTACYMFILWVLLISTAQHLLSHGFHGKRSIYCLLSFSLFFFFCSACSCQFENISKNKTTKVKSNTRLPLFPLFIFSCIKYVACPRI